MSSIQRKIAKGAAWMMTLMLLDRFLGLISTIILVRLIMPADFGIIAMCTSLIAGLGIFTAFGFDMVLIQKQQATRAHYDTAWTFQVLTGCLVAILIAAAAIPLTHFYREPRLELPLYFLAAAFFLASFENIAVVDFRKNMEFHKEVILRLSQKLIGFCVTIPTAYVLRNYWALVIGMVVLNITKVTLSYIMRPYRPRLTFLKRAEIFEFSTWLFLSNTISFARTRASDFIIGRWCGARALGLFTVAQEMSEALTMQLVSSINRAAYPGYSKIANDHSKLRRTYLQLIGIIALIALPAGAGISSISDDIALVILGENWVNAAPLIRVLALAGALSALSSNSQYIFTALGKPKYTTYLLTFQIVILLPALILMTLFFGLLGAASAILITSFITLPIIGFGMYRTVGVTPYDYLSNLWRPALAAAIMYSLVKLFLAEYSLYFSGLTRLSLSILVGATAYVLSLTVLVALFSTPQSIERMLLHSYLLPWLRNRFKKLF